MPGHLITAHRAIACKTNGQIELAFSQMFAVDKVACPFLLAAFETTFNHKLTLLQMLADAGERATKLARPGRALVGVLFDHSTHKRWHRQKRVLPPANIAPAADWAVRQPVARNLPETPATHWVLATRVNNWINDCS